MEGYPKLSTNSTKKSVSVTLDDEVVESIDGINGVKRSTLLNDIARDWLDKTNNWK